MNEEPKGTFSIRIDEKVKERLQRLAEETGRSIGWLIRAAIYQYLERYDRPADK